MSPYLHAFQIAGIVFVSVVIGGMVAIGMLYLITAPNEPDQVGDEHP